MATTGTVSIAVTVTFGPIGRALAGAMAMRAVRMLGIGAKLETGATHAGRSMRKSFSVMTVAVAMLMMAMAIPIDMAHDHASADELLHQLFVFNGHGDILSFNKLPYLSWFIIIRFLINARISAKINKLPYYLHRIVAVP